MRATIKDATGKILGVWVAKTNRGFNLQQQKEIEKARNQVGRRDAVVTVDDQIGNQTFSWTHHRDMRGL